MNTKNNLYILLALSLLPTQAFSFYFSSGFEPARQVANNPQATVMDLSSILQQDNLTALKTFIANNPSFNWNTTYQDLPWTVEYASPLIAATWFGAKKCVSFMLDQNIGYIRSSLTLKSSHGFIPLQYAKNPPKKRSFKNQTTSNYAAIAKKLEKYS